MILHLHTNKTDEVEKATGKPKGPFSSTNKNWRHFCLLIICHLPLKDKQHAPCLKVKAVEGLEFIQQTT
jgi:hypothetical protein